MNSRKNSCNCELTRSASCPQDRAVDSNAGKVEKEKSSLCWCIKLTIHNLKRDASSKQPSPNKNRDLLGVRHINKIELIHSENISRSYDPFLIEVNRHIYIPTQGFPVSGTSEYDRAAEKYALYGNDFLDFPRDLSPFLAEGTSSLMKDYPNEVASTKKAQSPPSFGLEMAEKEIPDPMITKANTIQPPSFVNARTPNYGNHAYVQPNNTNQMLSLNNPVFVAQNSYTVLQENHIKVCITQKQRQQLYAANIRDWMFQAHLLQQQNQLIQSHMLGSNYVAPGMSTTTVQQDDSAVRSLQGNTVNDPKNWLI